MDPMDTGERSSDPQIVMNGSSNVPPEESEMGDILQHDGLKVAPPPTTNGTLESAVHNEVSEADMISIERPTRPKRNATKVMSYNESPTPPPSSRPKRARTSKTDVDKSSVPPSTPSKSKAKQPQSPHNPKSRTRSNIWTPEHLLTNRKSKLVSCNLSDLINREVWGMLSPEDQAECMSLLPSSDIVQTTHEEGDSTTIESKLIDTFFEKNISLQEDMRTFQENLEDGRFEPIYLEKAALARQKRLKGDFDKWKDEQYELWWGQNQKLSYGALAGDTTKLKVTDMAQHGMLQENDIWRYSRAFHGGIITVKKELTCVAVNPETFALTFHCPPKRAEYLKSGSEPVVFEDIETPTTLETKLLDEDGRVARSERPNGNAFKVIRIIRGTEDIGSLFDVRMSAFEKLNL